jgi:predicted DNA-binding transcriptional regulator AlpA
MSQAPRRNASTAAPGLLKLAEPPGLVDAIEPHRLLWGWPEILAATGINRRVLEREISAGRFPKPIRRVGRRPYWKPADVIRWCEGGRTP